MIAVLISYNCEVSVENPHMIRLSKNDLMISHFISHLLPINFAFHRVLQSAPGFVSTGERHGSQEEEEEFYKLLPANKADHLCQLWQSCSDLHKIQTVYDVVENPHSIRLSKK